MASPNTRCIEEAEAVIKTTEGVPSIELLTRDILTCRLHKLRQDLSSELCELKERQKEVHRLHEIIAKINVLTNENSEIELDDELFEMLQGTLKNDEYGDTTNERKIDASKLRILQVGETYKPEERQRLIENIRMHIENLNTQNDMQLQAVTQLTNELYEAYQLAKAIEKPLDEDKKNKARAISGR